MPSAAADFERYERIGAELVFEAVDRRPAQLIDARLARARFGLLMDRAAAAATREGRDIDDITCERWVETGDSADGPWRLTLLEEIARSADDDIPRRFMRAMHLRGTIQLSGPSI